MRDLVDLKINTEESDGESVFEHLKSIRETISGFAELIGKIVLPDYSEKINNIVQTIGQAVNGNAGPDPITETLQMLRKECWA